MIKFKDSSRGKVRGVLEVTRIDKEGVREDCSPEDNVILIQSSEILRDLMFSSNDARITHMGFGDMNLTQDDNLVEIEPASDQDTGLIREVGRVATTSVADVIDEAPAIIYTALVDYNMMNGPGQQIITEYCLFTGDGRAFNKKTRSALIKDSEFAYEFRWTLRFI